MTTDKLDVSFRTIKVNIYTDVVIGNFKVIITLN